MFGRTYWAIRNEKSNEKEFSRIFGVLDEKPPDFKEMLKNKKKSQWVVISNEYLCFMSNLSEISEATTQCNEILSMYPNHKEALTLYKVFSKDGSIKLSSKFKSNPERTEGES